MGKNMNVTKAEMPGSPASRWKEPEERMNGPFDDYEVTSALRTLTKAIKIRANRKLLAACRVEAKKQQKAAEATSKQLQGA